MKNAWGWVKQGFVPCLLLLLLFLSIRMQWKYSALERRVRESEGETAGLERRLDKVIGITIQRWKREDGRAEDKEAESSLYAPSAVSEHDYGAGTVPYTPRATQQQRPHQEAPTYREPEIEFPRIERPTSRPSSPSSRNSGSAFGETKLSSQKKCLDCQGTGQCRWCKNSKGVDAFGKPIKCPGGCVNGRCKMCGGTGVFR